MKYLINTFLLASVTAMSASSFAADTYCNSSIKKDYVPAHFVSLKNGTIKDTRTGLVWSLCSVGQTWTLDQNGKETCKNAPTSFPTWKNALDAVVAENANPTWTVNDWRMPNIKELDSIVDRSCYNPSINQDIFPNTYPVNYYSSTPYKGSDDSVADSNYDHITSRIISFRTGLENPIRPEGQTRESYSIRLVRCGEWPVSDACKAK
ncbi:DUF1566 domain-containing protein [Motilimonas cestriensis]|uniref:Lcl C-terminal domain-containing protein n=1 Tax=Motilimonas cestriensis TaxID=2742685 RepID=UPI003DA41B22